MQVIVNDFENVVVSEAPLIDVRAPIEFAAGAAPRAINLPLLTDDERHRVGLCHKQCGGQEALACGHRLVSGVIRERRIDAWSAFVRQHTETYLYCARGGRRSEIAQQWLTEALGITVPRLRGGYKAFRAYLSARLEPASITSKPIILGGRTGAGKTPLLNALDNSIDLEAIAHHRGSTFGRFTTPQPGQADFEHRLAAALIKHGHQGFSHLIVEDEGRHVGTRFVPANLCRFLAAGDFVLLEAPLALRIERIFDEYVLSGQAIRASQENKGDPPTRWFADMNASMDRIGKRLGPHLLRRLKQSLADAFSAQVRTGDPTGHKSWIEELLVKYYDPMYDYQIDNKRQVAVFTGGATEVLEYLQGKG